MPLPNPKQAAAVQNGRARILQAGIDLAAQSGPSGMTISQICLEARVKPPAIYYHFGSKEGLLAAVLGAVAEAWLDRLAADQPKGADLAARLRAAVDGWQAMIEDPARPILLLLSLQLQCAEASAEIRASLVRVHELARQVIAAGIRPLAGELPGLDLVCDQVLGLVQSAALAFHLEADRDQLHARLLEVGRLIETRILAAGLPLADSHPSSPKE